MHSFGAIADAGFWAARSFRSGDKTIYGTITGGSLNGPIQATNGDLYGTTVGGGQYNQGTVIKVIVGD